MNKELVGALVQLLISLAGAGLVVQLLLLRQNRRKIDGEASANEANAASTLSGAAMAMVENAQKKEKEAEDRADAKEALLDKRTQEYEARKNADARDLEDARWLTHHMRMHIAILEGALRQVGVEPVPFELPPAPRPEILPPTQND